MIGMWKIFEKYSNIFAELYGFDCLLRKSVYKKRKRGCEANLNSRLRVNSEDCSMHSKEKERNGFGGWTSGRMNNGLPAFDRSSNSDPASGGILNVERANQT